MLRINNNMRIITASIAVVISFILYKILAYHAVTIVMMIITILLSALPAVRKAVGALRYRIIGIDLLVTVAVIGAVVIGEYWEAAAVSYLFLLGGFLEIRTLEKTRASIKTLLNLAPISARVQRDGQSIIVSPEEVRIEELVIVKQGERIAVDGTVIDGSASVDEATITGESLPVEKSFGMSVYSGTVVSSGYIVIKTERIGKDTTFSRILNLVEEAQDSKAKTQKFMEKFASFYTPIILALAVIVGLISQDIRLALTFLVISCPGALVISVPVSIVAGIGNGAHHGVLIKGGEVMEKIGTLKAIAFDKTGTLTEGTPSVVGIKTFGYEEHDLLVIAAAGESLSEHPLAQAIVEEASKRNIVFDKKVSDMDFAMGKGIAFTIDDERYWIGNQAFVSHQQIDTDVLKAYINEEESKGRTVVIVAVKNGVIGAISLADTIRDTTKNTISLLKAAGIRHIAMLTGDNKQAAETIAALAGIDEVRYSMLPDDKVKAIRQIRETYKTVAMVGDGVNDAPSLASADLGFAIGAARSDVAMETADVVLLGDSLTALPFAIHLGKATVRNMKQNIIFALLVVTLLLAGVLFHVVDLSIGMLVHELSVLLVVFNAMRLLRFKTPKIKV
ncbi:MAG: cation-translocating P-type ATPase [Sphaerochaetaceae bacterium]|jgi:Cd2+/Zn2+-exporting ATPase|nr:cation-translocating P-type ATPase [Sphaerochaetaceae bacterium]NLO59708.1 cation-translocating P-type ATPase [Spirochaetales bacterium]MDD2405806.1 cation-translocating P-type ATPase [Sphaerochaetaceae bacterium]MDD3669675.1 cation-translocating P-type ATPase [Sphaerochaetaceae bacterium]MDD4258356.1 cation-translocating P-type ATPase [Sphaerochaetaceae bacterium]